MFFDRFVDDHQSDGPMIEGLQQTLNYIVVIIETVRDNEIISNIFINFVIMLLNQWRSITQRMN